MLMECCKLVQQLSSRYFFHPIWKLWLFGNVVNTVGIQFPSNLDISLASCVLSTSTRINETHTLFVPINHTCLVVTWNQKLPKRIFSLNRKRRNNMSYKAIENEAWKTNYPFAIAKVHFYIKLSCRAIKSL